MQRGVILLKDYATAISIVEELIEKRKWIMGKLEEFERKIPYEKQRVL